MKSQLDEKSRLKILKYVYLEKKSKVSIAKMFNIDRKTVYNICKRYENCPDDILNKIKSYEFDSDCTITLLEFKKSKRRKITDSYIKAIKECCSKYLNCYFTEVEYCAKICFFKNLAIKNIVNYNPSHIYSSDNFIQKQYVQKIREIRRYTHFRKNYLDVYEEYQKTSEFINNPISYSSFYLIAKQFWIDKGFKYKTLGECVDNQCKNDSIDTLRDLQKSIISSLYG